MLILCASVDKFIVLNISFTFYIIMCLCLKFWLFPVLNCRICMWLQIFRPHCILHKMWNTHANDGCLLQWVKAMVFDFTLSGHSTNPYTDVQHLIKQDCIKYATQFCLKTRVFSQQLSVIITVKKKKPCAWIWPFMGFRRVKILCLHHHW